MSNGLHHPRFNHHIAQLLFDGHWIPITDNVYNFGSATLGIKELHIATDYLLKESGSKFAIRNSADSAFKNIAVGDVIDVGGVTLIQKIAAGLRLGAVGETIEIIGLVADGETEFTDDDATPSVLDHTSFYETYANPTNVTDLDDGVEGQVIYIRGTSGNLTFVHGTNIFFASGANHILIANEIVGFINRNGDKWYCLEQL